MDHSGRSVETRPDAEREEHERCGNLEAMSFYDVAARFEAADASGARATVKLELIFDRELRERVGRQSIYPVARLLLPGIDNGRRTFGIKAKSLAKVYLKLTRLERAPLTNDAARKLQYHAGNAEARGAFEGSELGQTVREVLRDRLNVARGTLTVGAIHAFLNEVALAKTNHVELFKKIYARLSPVEHKWLVRVVLLAPKLGVKENHVFRFLHPNAQAKYATSTSLSAVCASFAAGGPGRVEALAGGGGGAAALTAGTPFKPHLSHGSSTENDQAGYALRTLARASRVAGLASADAGAPPFVADLKIDGERLCYHVARSGEESWWTRATTNYTELYGPCLAPHVAPLRMGLDELILDGEVVAVDLGSGAIFGAQRMLNFGSNQMVAKVEHLIVDARRRRGARPHGARARLRRPARHGQGADGRARGVLRAGRRARRRGPRR